MTLRNRSDVFTAVHNLECFLLIFTLWVNCPVAALAQMPVPFENLKLREKEKEEGKEAYFYKKVHLGTLTIKPLTCGYSLLFSILSSLFSVRLYHVVLSRGKG